MVIGPGRVIFSFRVVWARASRASVGVHAALQAQLADDPSAPSPCSGPCGCPSRPCCSKSMPSTNSRKPCTKCWRDCSPSQTMSMPASSCSFSDEQRRVALGAASSSPSKRQGAQRRFGSASQEGLWQRAGDGGRKERHRRNLARILGDVARDGGTASPSPACAQCEGGARTRTLQAWRVLLYAA